ncbi:MAG TPA: hypothetical protein VGA37_00425 [Gemmatimonadales bacterium]
MLVRYGVAIVGVVMLVSSVYAQEEGARRAPVKAFPFAVLPYVALGFRGVRANEADSLTCPGFPLDCHQHRASSGPAVGAAIQAPIGGGFGLSLGFHASRPHRSRCTQGSECDTRESLTGLQGTALLLFRFKARAPIYFGLGASGSQLTPGPVRGQEDPVTEIGGVFVLGVDAAIGQKIGARVTWSNYFMAPSGDNLPGGFKAEGMAYDALITIGARIQL